MPSSFSPYFFSAACFSLLLLGCVPKSTENSPSDEATNSAAQLRQRAIDDYVNYYQTSTNDFIWRGSTNSCTPGSVAQSTQDRFLKRVNYYRRLVGLPTNTSLTTLLNEKAQQAALMMQANLRASGTPNPSWSCYTVDGANAWSNALLADGYTASDAVDAWIIDDTDATGALLDRRWILYSRAKTYGHGSADNFAAFYCKHNFSNPPPTLPLPEFIAYPPKAYIVTDLFSPNMRWSFSIPNADFRAASVTVKNADNIAIQTTRYPPLDLEADNTFVFQPRLSYALTKDTKFSVTVANVKVNGVFKTYNYEVIWVKR